MLVSCGTPKGVDIRSVVPGHSGQKIPAVPHIVVIMMENEAAGSILGNPNAPYINDLIRRYGYAAAYYGVTHPSLPNYVSTIAGNYFGSHSDSPSQRFPGRNLVDLLERHQRSWKGYMEDLPAPGWTGNAAPNEVFARYVRRHDPFLLMDDVLNDPRRLQHVVPLTQLSVDLAGGRLPNFAYIVPNLCHDMHGSPALSIDCVLHTRLIRAGDTFLAELVPRIVHSKSWTGNSVLFIVWDEGTDNNGCCAGPINPGGGLIPAIVVAREGVRHYTSRATYNHYSLLKTIETVWHLGCVGVTCSPKVQPMTEFLR